MATLFLGLLLAATATLQGGEAPQDTATLEAGDAQIEVRAVTEDASIQDRLRGILATTGRYADLELRVENGIVLLEGTVVDRETGQWVEDLAGRTEGVVAVLNGLELHQAPLWDLAPARREVLALWRELLVSLPRIGAGLVVLLAALLFAGGLSKLLVRPLERRLKNELLRTVATKLVTAAVWLTAAYLFLRISGLTQLAVTVVGGTGILGIVLGFAFRDIAENFLASVLISLQRPFRYGDTIEVAGHTGVVQRVTPRGTILMDYDGNHIQIPNAQVYKSVLVNQTANPRIREQFSVGVGFETDLARAQGILMQVLRDHTAVLSDPAPTVLVERLGSASVELRAYFWIDGSQHSRFKVRSSLQRQTVRVFQEAKISMPDDSREVIFPQGVPVTLQRSRGEVAPEAPPAAAQHPQSADESTDGEGALTSEAVEIQEQVLSSRQPEEGVDVLAD